MFAISKAMGRIKSESGLGVRRGPKGRGANTVKNGFDGPIVGPWRKVRHSFDQTATLVRDTHPDTVPPPSDKLRKTIPNPEKPRPVFWARSLEGVYAMAPIHKGDKITLDGLERNDEYIRQRLALPENVKSFMSVLKEESAVLSYVSALCSQNRPDKGVVGQLVNSTKRTPDNPFYSVKSDQPLVMNINKIEDSEIQKQEQQILDIRKRLTELRNSYTFRPSH